MLCVPIVSIKTGSVIAVACVFNKTLPEKRYTLYTYSYSQTMCVTVCGFKLSVVAVILVTLTDSTELTTLLFDLH